MPGYLKINQKIITPSIAKKLVSLCPFGAIEYIEERLAINSACKMCRLCIKNGPKGAVVFVDEKTESVDKAAWSGIAVYADHDGKKVHNVTFELIGKARELADATGQNVYVLLIGSGINGLCRDILRYGVDCVYVYDSPELADFRIETYTNAFEDFINKVKPSSVLVGATNLGRSVAPRVAARFRTGLTADCTVLEIKKNTDLVQIRPAFGGNIMAQIVTPRHRPQLCTVRYKIFSAPDPVDSPWGKVVTMRLAPEKLKSDIEILDKEQKPREIDISEADVIVAAGRGVKSQADLEIVAELSGELGAQMACTRPLVEAGWFGAKRQIGLSGRTVGAKLIITAGVSGSVQFAAGMRGCDCIVAINSDRHAPIFDIAHYGMVGDLYEIIPRLITRIKEMKGRGV